MENGFLTFSNPLRPDTLDVIARASELRNQVNIIIDGHVAIAKETCRVINMGTQILTIEVIPAHEADTLGDRFGELVESCDGFVGADPEHDFQIVQVTRGLNRGGSTVGLDRGPTMGLVWGARSGSSTEEARLVAPPRGSTGRPDGKHCLCSFLLSSGAVHVMVWGLCSQT